VFLKNLNFYIAACIVFECVVSFIVRLIMSAMHANDLSLTQLAYIQFGLPLFIVCSIFAILWWRKGLSPKVVALGKERRHRTGHKLMAVFNISALSSVVLPFVFVIVTGNPESQLYGFLLMPLVFLMGIGAVIGIFMVHTSRAP